MGSAPALACGIPVLCSKGGPASVADLDGGNLTSSFGTLRDVRHACHPSPAACPMPPIPAPTPPAHRASSLVGSLSSTIPFSANSPISDEVAPATQAPQIRAAGSAILLA